MHLPTAFQFALKIGKFFALTTFNHVNSISQQRCNKEKCNPSAVELKTMLFSENYFLKSFKSHDPIPLTICGNRESPVKSYKSPFLY
jgi:hypothetical protein